MLYTRRVWRNGSVLESTVVCYLCQSALNEYNGLLPGDEQTFSDILESQHGGLACECDEHALNEAAERGMACCSDPNWQATDTQGHEMECANCGKLWRLDQGMIE